MNSGAVGALSGRDFNCGFVDVLLLVVALPVQVLKGVFADEVAVAARGIPAGVGDLRGGEAAVGAHRISLGRCLLHCVRFLRSH